MPLSLTPQLFLKDGFVKHFITLDFICDCLQTAKVATSDFHETIEISFVLDVPPLTPDHRTLLNLTLSAGGLIYMPCGRGLPGLLWWTSG